MLRVILGVCGAVFIALGVFGGQLLSNVGGAVDKFFTPDTDSLVLESTPTVTEEPVSEQVVAASESSLIKTDLSDTVLAKSAPDGTELITAKPLQPDLQIDGDGEVSPIKTAVAAPLVEDGPTDVKAQPVVAAKLEIETSRAVTEVKAAARKEHEAVADASLLPKEIDVQKVVTTTTGTGPNNTLYVVKERVNLREGPSINHPVVLQLAVGQELMEFKRDGKWVHVGAYGTSGKIGWVHSNLVGKN